MGRNPPARFLVEALGTGALEARIGGCDLARLPDTQTLLRAVSTIPLRWPFEELDEAACRGWLLAERDTPIGLLLDDGVHDLCFLDLTSMNGDAGSGAQWQRIRASHLNELLECCRRADGARMKIGIDFPTKSFKVYWTALRVAEHAPFEMPVFLDVYPPDSEFVVELLRCVTREIRSTDSVLVLGSGAGPEAVCVAASTSASVDAVDIGELEVANTRASVAWNGLDEQVRVWRSDGLTAVSCRYDRIIFNAPISIEKDFAAWNPRIMDPGAKLMGRVLDDLDSRLAPGGAMYVMAFPARLQPIAAAHSGWRFEPIGDGSLKEFRIYRVSR